MYFYTILTVHSLLCITLVGLVLLQQGKGADAGATFGGGSSNSVFGAAGAADFITKLTTSLAIGFMVTSILLIRAYSSDTSTIFAPVERDLMEGSVMQEVAPAEAANVEAVNVEVGDAQESAAPTGPVVNGEAPSQGDAASQGDPTSQGNPGEEAVEDTAAPGEQSSSSGAASS
ncbi:preprotein translocase subunit SecG [bacterium]|nr:preprotein translocase subunit SecG [bacterium]